MNVLIIATVVALLASTEAISLYEFDDPVVELVESNSSVVFNSSSIWFLEFYLHWCGHCQRFKDRWVDLSGKFEGWNGTVHLAAMNCAENDCTEFDVIETPAIRGFYPDTPMGSTIGVRITIGNSMIDEVLDFIESASTKGLAPDGIPNLRPYISSSPLFEWSQTGPEVRGLIFLFEKTPDLWARNFMLDLGVQREWHIRRIVKDTTGNNPMFEHLESFPAVMVLTRDDSSDGSSSAKIYHMNNYTSVDDIATQAKNVLMSLNNETSSMVDVTTTMRTTSTTREIYLGGHNDTVYLTDIELALKYSLLTEVAMQPILDASKLDALYRFLQVAKKYLPLKDRIRYFLQSLAEWPIKMNLHHVSNEEYLEKINELTDYYHPFNSTPTKWMRCLGSSSLYRGYPCSLWTLFHTLTVNEALSIGEDGNALVATAMVDYIHHFFGCRHCAENFAHKVEQLGELPQTGTEAMLWLWKIHNKGNVLLKGDKTEDPQYPKLIWPTTKNCPKCRGSEMIEGVGWHIPSLTKYLFKIYRKERIVVPYDKQEQYVTKRDALMDEIAHLEDRSKIMDKVNEYCTNQNSLLHI